jgi:Cd2+/Zn2+-exporting ATPase
LIMKVYRISGLDCVNCANLVEGAIRKLDGMESASVSFATESVHIPTDDADTLARVVDTIKRVEPDAELVMPSEQHGDRPGDGPANQSFFRSNRLRFVRFGLALVLIVTGVITRSALQATPYRWAEYAVFLSAYLLAGWPVLAGAVRNIVRGRLFDEMFLMSVATVGAIAIHELSEAVAVMLFYAVGEFFQDLAVERSRRSISELMDLRPDFVRLLTPDRATEVAPETVEVGATIEVRPGERIPLDGDVVDGESAVDTSALTGESVPRSVAPGEHVLAGFVNESGKLRIHATNTYADSAVARVLELVENAAARKAPTERFISRFAAVYTPIMVGLAAAVAFIPPLLLPGATLGEWVYRALVLLVISCPCALVISIPLGYFGGIGGAARRHILIKGANYMDALKNVSTVVLDKTGTLTRGTFSVTEVVGENGYTEPDLLRWAAAAEAHSTHPIARSIWRAYDSSLSGNPVDPATVTEVREERGYGVTARVDGTPVLAGSERLLIREGVTLTPASKTGTVVHIAVAGTYAGYIMITDEIKPEAKRAVAALKALGVSRTVMLTGDNADIAATIAREVGIDEYRADLLPKDKVTAVETLQSELPSGRRLAFIGDGINDAPVLVRSDVGFAMGGLGSDAAIEAADVVLMDDRLDRLPDALAISRFTRKIVVQNIVFALGIKAIFLGLGAFGIASMWEAVIADVGVALLAVFNAMRTLRYFRGHGAADDGAPVHASRQLYSGS